MMARQPGISRIFGIVSAQPAARGGPIKGLASCTASTRRVTPFHGECPQVPLASPPCFLQRVVARTPAAAGIDQANRDRRPVHRLEEMPMKSAPRERPATCQAPFPRLRPRD